MPPAAGRPTPAAPMTTAWRLVALVSTAAAFQPLPAAHTITLSSRSACRQCSPIVACADTEVDIFPAPSQEQSAALETAKPSPGLSPRDVVATMLAALHKSNIDSPRARFGCEVVLRFLSPSNPASRVTPLRFGQYLGQAWYLPLLDWGQYRWEGDEVTLGNGQEAFQQVAVRDSPAGQWASVRWILKRHKTSEGDEWRVDSVFVQEPDGGLDSTEGEQPDNFFSGSQAYESPAEVVLKVMRSLREPDTPYPLHGCEMAIRYCSPTNAASRLSPSAFQQYLREPWYRILLEWDEIQLEEEEEEDDGSVVQQSVLVRRTGDPSWTIVNWQLSLYSGRWLMDSLTITE